MAILKLTNQIFESLEKNEHTIGFYIDLKKAFETGNHSILLEKFNLYGIRGTPLNWMHRYLSSRFRYVQIDSFKSPLLSIKYGVPQGSLLGPHHYFFYTLMANLHVQIISHLYFFADETNVFFQHKNISELIKIVNCELFLLATCSKLTN